MASKSLGVLTLDLVAKIGGFEQGLDKAGRSSEKWRKQTERDAQAASAAMQKNLLIVTAAATAAGAALIALTKTSVSAIDTQFSLSKSLDTSYDSLTALGLAAKDASLDGLDGSLTRLNRRLGAAERGAGAAAKAVEILGLDLAALSNMDAVDRIAYISDAIKDSGASMQVAARHAQDLGFEQKQAAEFFMQGGDAIRAYNDEVVRLGLSVSDYDAARLGDAVTAMSDLGELSKAAGQQLAIAVIPALEATADGLQYLIDNGAAEKLVVALEVVAKTAAAVAVVMGTRVVASALTSAAAFAAGTLESIRYQAALARMAGVSTGAAARLTALAVAARAANAAMAVAGGPLGVVLLAASALVYFTTRGKEATEQTIALTTAVNDLNDAQRDVAAIEATRRIEELSEQAKTLADNLKFAAENSAGAGRRAKRYSEDAAFLRVALAEVNDEIQTYRDRLTELAGSESTIADTADTASEAFQKLNKQLRERFILVGLNSEADKLAARIAAGYVEGLEEGEGDILVALQRQIDAREKNIKAIESAAKASSDAASAAAAEEKNRLEGIANEITAIERAAQVWGMSADEVKLYDLTVQGATDAQLMHARSLQETVAGFEEAKKAKDSYLQLVQDLRTEEEKLTDQLHAQLAVLDAIAATGGIGSDEYRQTAGRITEGLFSDSEAPSFAGVDAGPLGELSKLDDAEKELQKWYDTQMEMLATFREERADLNEEWDERERDIKQQHEDALAAIERSRWQVGLDSLDGILTDMQALRESDNKKGQQAAKAAAIVQATINAYTAATGAYASASAIPVVGWVLGPVAAAAALAAGLANVSAIQGMAHDGIDSIPQTGTWLLEKGERVTTANTSARLDATLARIQGDMDEQRGGRQSVRGGFTLNQTNNFGSPDNRTATQVATATARRQRTASARLGS